MATDPFSDSRVIKPAKVKKVRLDQLLFDLGLADSKEIAARHIMAGLVYVNGQKADKPGVAFKEDAPIEVREILPYVSRGGLKLAKGLKVFPFSAEGIVGLDVGASTGGFTDVLLQHGALKVYAVDVGHGQLHYKLQNDERVINMERTHVRKLDDHPLPEAVDAIVIDTSFISLTKVLPHAWPFLKPGGWCVALIKPQFEVDPKHLDKGVVRDDEMRQWSVDKVSEFVKAELPNAEIVGLDESPIKGPKGNVEFLLGIQKGL